MFTVSRQTKSTRLDRLLGGGAGTRTTMDERDERQSGQELQSPKTTERTSGGTAGLPGEHAAPKTNYLSEDEISDTVAGSGTSPGDPAADIETPTSSNG